MTWGWEFSSIGERKLAAECIKENPSALRLLWDCRFWGFLQFDILLCFHQHSDPTDSTRGAFPASSPPGHSCPNTHYTETAVWPYHLHQLTVNEMIFIRYSNQAKHHTVVGNRQSNDPRKCVCPSHFCNWENEALWIPPLGRICSMSLRYCP